MMNKIQIVRVCGGGALVAVLTARTQHTTTICDVTFIYAQQTATYERTHVDLCNLLKLTTNRWKQRSFVRTHIDNKWNENRQIMKLEEVEV